jgi:hypothetical protein
MRKRSVGLPAVLRLAPVAAAGCQRQVPVAPASPPPARVQRTPASLPPKEPEISRFAAEPGAIERGQSTSLHWPASNAAETSIESGMGMAPAERLKLISCGDVCWRKSRPLHSPPESRGTP